MIHDTGLRVGYWRSVSHALNVVRQRVVHRRDGGWRRARIPYEFRLALLDKQPRFKQRAASSRPQKAGWGKPLPRAAPAASALMEGYDTYMAQVAEVSVSGRRIRVHRVVVAADLGQMVNPEHRHSSRSRAASSSACSAALYGEITLKDGRVQQTNFHDYQLLRMPESPKIEMHLVKSTEKPGGIGEPGTALIAPTVANAVFARDRQAAAQDAAAPRVASHPPSVPPAPGRGPGLVRPPRQHPGLPMPSTAGT